MTGDVTYELRVAGHLDDHWSSWLDDLVISRRTDGTSALTGSMADQAQLHGLLARLRDMGAPLVSLRLLETPVAGNGTTADPSYRADVPDRQVLVVGLDPYRVPGPWDPKPMAEAIAVGLASLAERGFHTEACLVGLDGSDDLESTISAALQGRPWDCVLVGGGIRKREDLLELFESVVNLVVRHAPQAAIAFNSEPDDIADAVSRRLG